MKAFDAQRFDALAARLRLPARHVLVAATRLAAEGEVADAIERRRAIINARASSGAADDVAVLLATPIASFAQDEVDRALAQLWPVRSAVTA